MTRYLVLIALLSLLAFDILAGTKPSTVRIEVDCLQLVQKGFSWVDFDAKLTDKVELVCTQPDKVKPDVVPMPRGLKVGLDFNKEINK
jgi:hypothetical protein